MSFEARALKGIRSYESKLMSPEIPQSPTQPVSSRLSSLQMTLLSGASGALGGAWTPETVAVRTGQPRGS